MGSANLEHFVHLVTNSGELEEGTCFDLCSSENEWNKKELRKTTILKEERKLHHSVQVSSSSALQLVCM